MTIDADRLANIRSRVERAKDAVTNLDGASTWAGRYAGDVSFLLDALAATGQARRLESAAAILRDIAEVAACSEIEGGPDGCEGCRAREWIEGAATGPGSGAVGMSAREAIDSLGEFAADAIQAGEEGPECRACGYELDSDGRGHSRCAVPLIDDAVRALASSPDDFVDCETCGQPRPRCEELSPRFRERCNDPATKHQRHHSNAQAWTAPQTDHRATPECPLDVDDCYRENGAPCADHDTREDAATPPSGSPPAVTEPRPCPPGCQVHSACRATNEMARLGRWAMTGAVPPFPAGEPLAPEPPVFHDDGRGLLCDCSMPSRHKRGDGSRGTR